MPLVFVAMPWRICLHGSWISTGRVIVGGVWRWMSSEGQEILMMVESARLNPPAAVVLAGLPDGTKLAEEIEEIFG